MIWDSAQLTRFLDEGEVDLATRLDCIVDRIAIPIVLGTYEYALADYILGIKRVTWKGQKLDPWNYFSWLQVFQPILDSGSIIPMSRPDFYIYNEIGAKSIILYPVPAETISSTTSGLWGSAIPDKAIVEFYRLPDTSGETHRVPAYIRRRILKCYALWKLLAQEGEGQDLEASQYYAAKYEYYVQLSVTVLKRVFVSRLRGFAPSFANRAFPGRPVLPINLQNRSE